MRMSLLQTDFCTSMMELRGLRTEMVFHSKVRRVRKERKGFKGFKVQLELLVLLALWVPLVQSVPQVLLAQQVRKVLSERLVRKELRESMAKMACVDQSGTREQDLRAVSQVRYRTTFGSTPQMATSMFWRS